MSYICTRFYCAWLLWPYHSYNGSFVMVSHILQGWCTGSVAMVAPVTVKDISKVPCYQITIMICLIYTIPWRTIIWLWGPYTGFPLFFEPNIYAGFTAFLIIAEMWLSFRPAAACLDLPKIICLKCFAHFVILIYYVVCYITAFMHYWCDSLYLWFAS